MQHNEYSVGVGHALLALTRLCRATRRSDTKAAKEIEREFQCHKTILFENNPMFFPPFGATHTQTPPTALFSPLISRYKSFLEKITWKEQGPGFVPVCEQASEAFFWRDEKRERVDGCEGSFPTEVVVFLREMVRWGVFTPPPSPLRV